MTDLYRKHRRSLLAGAACALAGGVLPVRPAGAQATVDVPFVPTPPNVIDAMLQIADVKRDDYLIDLGCGDGRIVLAAARKFGTRGFGIDLDPVNIGNARREAERLGLTARATFAAGDLFNTDLSKATVVTLYLLPEVNAAVRPLLFRQLKPGTRVLSHDFDMGEWSPDGRVTVAVPDKPYGPPTSAVLLWVMPHNAAGRWQWKMDVAGASRAFEVAIEQEYQRIELKPLVAGGPAKVLFPKLRNDQISFTLVRDYGHSVNHEFTGRVQGDVIKGRYRLLGDGVGSKVGDWQAKRVEKGDIRFSEAGAPAPAA
ncbi:MAG: SAM-dependent methyltransferase [Burkholderiales bacterium]